ncbi:gamma-glutamylcyclotransferase [Coleofasciculus chthonoplastes]|uniref:gamma-glutamylcyclotransferase n=1 Tax=Coleofasciculus chthonoplastes TaxID=64178 RepID=UPI0032FFD58C
MTNQPRDRQDSPSQSLDSSAPVANVLQFPQTEPTFYYFAYGSCMCPVDLKRSLNESTHAFVLGSAVLNGYRLGFNRKSVKRNCGVLDIVPDVNATVEGVLYRLPERFSDPLDHREEVPRGGYRRETVQVCCQGRIYHNVRTYVVVEKLAEELAPNDWYFNVVLRGAITCGLSESYCWQLFNHMHQLQQRHWQTQSLRSA